MKPEIKARWLAALRSGEYPQGRAFLRKHDKFCCLGVLCDLHAKETGNEWHDCELEPKEYFGEVSLLPPEVQAWAGIEKRPMLREGPLSELNDCGVDFAKIANLIEKQL